MNPFLTPRGTTIVGFILAIIAIIGFDLHSSVPTMGFITWLHVIVGVMWIGLLYYFNFVQVPAVGAALAEEGPGPAAINKYVAPRALFWFRWAALATWITGLAILGKATMPAFTFQTGFAVIGMGAWLGTIMLINVWMIIWPNQRRILGLNEVASSADEIAAAKFKALMASRVNTALSIPMLLAMSHGFG